MAEAKIAEKLTILNNVGESLLARLFNVKQMLESPERPAFLSDRAFEPVIKSAIKKFPQVEINKAQGSPLHSRREEIMDALRDAYTALVDTLEFKGAISELMTNIGAQGIKMNLTVNTGITVAFLRLLQKYVSILLLIAKIDDRRTVAALYSSAHEVLTGTGEASFPRMGQLLVDYDVPIKMLPEEFAPHCKIISNTLESMHEHFLFSYLPAGQMRKDNSLSITHNPATMTKPTDPDRVQLDMISVDEMVHWVSFAYLLIPNELINNHVTVLCTALSDGYALRLFRSETINPHGLYDTLFSHIKDAKQHSKLKGVLADQLGKALASAPEFHLNRRQYFRHTVRQLALLFKDKPGLLGPKASLVIKAIHMATDEINWLLRHVHAQIPKHKTKPNTDQLQDLKLPELLFSILQLYDLMRSYHEVVERYHVEYLNGYDASVLRDVLSHIAFAGRADEITLSFMDAVSGATVDGSNDFSGLRMDWLRLQAWMSAHNSPTKLSDHVDLAKCMNLVDFHTRLVDDLDSTLRNAINLSDFWFMKKYLMDVFAKTMEIAKQFRYLSVFPRICDFFSAAGNAACPTERPEIGRDSANMANHFLTKISQRAAEYVDELAKEHIKLGSQLLVSQAAKEQASAAKPSKGKGSKSKSTGAEAPMVPGMESQVHSKEVLMRMETLQKQVSDICWSLNQPATLTIFNYVFSPREYLVELLENGLGKAIVKLLRVGAEGAGVAKPSQFLVSLKSYMAALRSLENHITIDVSSILSNALLDQTLIGDGKRTTVATVYTNFYLDMLFKQAPAGNIYVSPSRRSLVSKGASPFKAEEFTDISELQALCTVLGPYGLKQLSDEMMQCVSSHMTEIKKTVLMNKDALEAIKTRIENVGMCNDALRRIKEMDDFTNRMIAIGVILSFRRMLLEALEMVISQRIPFVFNVIQDLHNSPANSERVDALAMSAGITSDVDPLLMQYMKAHCPNPDQDFNTWTLLMVMFAAATRQLAFNTSATFIPSLDVMDNNGHVLVSSIVELSSVLFTLTAASPDVATATVYEAQSEYVRLASVLLLRLQVAEKDLPKHTPAVFVLLERVVTASPFLTADVLEAHFPYGLVRTAYHTLFKQRSAGKSGKTKAEPPVF